MPILENKTQQKVLISQLRLAQDFFSRGIGLMFKPSLMSEEGLWISRCAWIQTCFMNFSIDCVFVDRQFRVKALYPQVQPWRMAGPVWGASSVFELPSGTIQRFNIQIGDQLHVGS